MREEYAFNLIQPEILLETHYNCHNIQRGSYTYLPIPRTLPLVPIHYPSQRTPHSPGYPADTPFSLHSHNIRIIIPIMDEAHA
jgi:hypothetical protein|uniref:Uncharacterized protein n=1 Tax=Picea glauca TaxID=3330 RepID=A0A101LZB9_PICGL|nr:hypothetical protein ABT39_MTgene5145 [Picea glauca]